MSYSMSPPPQKPAPNAPRPYSPYQNSGSPTNQSPYGPPPPKRQRMSPDPRSPPTNGAYGCPPSQPHGLPATGYGNPYAPQQPAPVQSPYGTPGGYAQSPQNSFNAPQPYPYQHSPWQSQPPTPAPQFTARQSSPPQQQSREMMPPPPRPNKDEREEKVGVEEIGDSLYGSGINLKDEENYMHSLYSNRHNTQGDSFSTNQNTSFGSSTMSPNNSFNLLTQGTSFGSQEAQNAFAGTMGQTRSQEDIEVEDRRKREVAANNLAQRRQHHLNNQFLLCNNVRKRMDRLALNQGVTLNVHGVWVKQPETNTMVNGAGTNGIAATGDRATGVVKEEPKAESLVNMGSAFESVVALISLATGERIRGLLDEANTLSRARRYVDHGRVLPPEFSDIAVGEGKENSEQIVPESITGTQWDGAPPTLDAADNEIPAAEREKSSTPQQTTSYQGLLNTHLRALASKDKAAEKDRLARREKRKRAAEAAANGDAAPADASTTTPDTTTNGAGTPADAAAPVKLTKKEAARQAKEKNSTTETQQHSNTNQTAAMMALGKKGSRYAWMSGGAAAMPTNRYAKPSASGSGTATPSAPKGGESGPTTPGAGAGGTAMARAGSGGGAGGESKAVEWGDWTEAGRAGAGVQMRDWLLVLERDGRERHAMERAILSLGGSDAGGAGGAVGIGAGLPSLAQGASLLGPGAQVAK